MHDDEDDIDEAERRREMYEQLCGTPDERAAEAREMAERAAKLKTDEVMAWCRQRAEARRDVDQHLTTAGPCDGAGRPLNDPAYKIDSVVTKSYGAPVTRRAAATAPASLTAEWQRYIEGRIKRELQAAERAHIRAAGETFIKDIVAVERDCAALRDRVQHLENEVADLFRMTRAQARDAEIAERLSQFDELADRLARLESGGRPLKVVG